MDTRTTFLILLIYTLLGVYSNGSSCPEGMFRGENDLCCKLCPPGTYLTSPCNESEGNSFCQQCPPQTYTDKSNLRSKCVQCTRCHPTQIVLEECESIQDRKCGCDPGKFLDTAFLYCKNCKKCPEGEGVESPCTGTADTKCLPCLKGRTFSDIASSKERCKPCTPCRGMMIEKEECNVTQDTICERRNESKTTITAPTKTLTSVSSPADNTTAVHAANADPVTSGPTNVNAAEWIIAISAVVSVIIIAIGAALCCLVRKTGWPNATSGTGVPPEETAMTEYNFPVPATSLDTPARTRSSQGLRGRRATNAVHRESDSQGSNSSLQGVSIGASGKSKTMVRDLPGHIFMELGKRLNPKSLNNWITLAGRLGFNNSDVKNFELSPDEAVQTVLDEWGQRNGSTVDILINELKEMKRDDCVQVLKQWDS